MGSEKLTLTDLIQAGFDGVVDMGKATPIVAFPIGFLDSIRRRCSELNKESILTLSLQAKQIQIDDIRAAIGDLYVDQQESRRQLEHLALAFVSFLQTHSVFPMSLEELLSGQVLILQRLDGIHETQGQLMAIAARTEEKLNDLAAGTLQAQFRGADNHGELQGRFHGDIDAAAERLKNCDPEGALALLEQIEKRHANKLTDREKYRIQANKGHAYRQKGDDSTAATCFFKAYSFQVQDEEAMAWASLAHQLKGSGERARELAVQAYGKNRNCSVAVARYVATMPEGTTVEECEKAIPDSLTSDCQVLCEVALLAFGLEDYARAEKFARQAVVADANEYFPQNLLGQALLAQERRKAQDAQSSDVVDADRLREAVECFTSSEQLGKKLRRDRDEALLCVNRGAAYALLKDYAKAEPEFRAALALAPDDVDVVYNFANHQHARGQSQPALSTLSAIPLAKRDARCVMLYWDAALATEDQDTMRQAWEDNRNVDLDVNGMVLPQRMTYFSLGSVIQASFGERDCAIRFLESPGDDVMPRFYRDLLQAQVYMVSKEISRAKPLLQGAATRFDDFVPDQVAKMLGRYLYQAELCEDAWIVLKNRISPTRVGNDTALLLNSALAAGHHDFVMEFCEALRRNGIFDEQAIDVEIDLHTKYHSFSKATSIARKCLGLETPLPDSFKRLLRLRLSSLGLASRRPDLIEHDASELPHWDEVDPKFCEAMVAALLETNTPVAAIDFAYDMFRRFPEEVSVWRAVVAAVFFPRPSRPDLPAIEVVGRDAAVRYRTEDTATERWIILESDAEAQGLLDEVSLDHPLAEAMTGMRVNDVVELPGPAGKATILEIIDKRVYRCRYCAENMAQRFPEDTMVWIMRGDPSEEHGETFVRRLLDKVETLKRGSEQIIDIFCHNEMPLSLLASRFRKTTFETALDASSESSRIPFRIAIGNEEEHERTNRWLGASSRVVIDATAFASIIQLSLSDILPEPQWSFSTSENVRTQVATFANPYLPAEDSAMRDQVRDFLSVLERSVETGEGDKLACLQPRPSEFHIQALGDDSLSSIALALDQDAVLWVDDRVVASVANEAWGARAVSTQTFLEAMKLSGKYDTETHYNLLLRMLVRGYMHIQLDTQGFEYAIKEAHGDLRDPRLEAVLALLADENVIAQNVVELSRQVIRCVWQQQLLAPRPESVTVRVLENVFSRSDGLELVRWVVQGLGNAFSPCPSGKPAISDLPARGGRAAQIRSNRPSP